MYHTCYMSPYYGLHNMNVIKYKTMHTDMHLLNAMYTRDILE